MSKMCSSKPAFGMSVVCRPRSVATKEIHRAPRDRLEALRHREPGVDVAAGAAGTDRDAQDPGHDGPQYASGRP